MTAIDNTNPITIFNSKARAEEIAEANTRNEDEGWTYNVERAAGGYVIVIRDETSEQLGVL